MRVIDAVGLDHLGRVSTVRWFNANSAANQLLTDHEIVPVIQVVDAIIKGDRVATVFYVEGHPVAGPNVMPAHDSATGNEWIAMTGEPIEGRTLLDLPRIESVVEQGLD